jgi:alpha-glucosidase
MDNESKAHFRDISGFPLSLVTWAHQVSMVITYYSPLQFMGDVSTSYLKKPHCLNFISTIPTTWHATCPLDSYIGEYITVVRKKGEKWFIGSMTNWTSRILKINCDFLVKEQCDVKVFKDGVNSDLNGNDYKKEYLKINAGDEMILDIASGGRWAAGFTPIK